MLKFAFQNGILSVDLFVKPSNTYQFIDPTSCYRYHCKKGKRYSQSLTLTSICSDNGNFYKRCNKLESWLVEKGYSKKMAKKKILPAHEHSRESVLEKIKLESNQKKWTYYK